MPVRKEFRDMLRLWKAMRTNPELKRAYTKIPMLGGERNALLLLTIKLEVPPENVRKMYERMRNHFNQRRAVQQTIGTLNQIEELTEQMNLRPWLQNNIRLRAPEDVLQDLRNQAQQVGALAA
jgi:hypothetical protein